MYSKLNSKLLITGLCLLLSVVLLATASFAWFTLSTSPEISGMQVRLFTDQAVLVSATIDGEYSQYIDLSEAFKYYAPLKPVSTINGKDWFIPEYNDDGTLAELDKFKKDSNLENANVLVYKQTGTDTDGKPVYTELTDDEYVAANQKGYYVYCTFYLKTQLEEGCSVTLSAPDRNNENIEQWETEQNDGAGVYGSYVLGNYEIDEDEELATIDNNAQNAMRVGFLTADSKENERFVIYEPNADKRSSITNKPEPEADGSADYIYGYSLKKNPSYTDGGTEPMYLNYKDNAYIPTKPIGLDKDGNVAALDIKGENLIVQKSSSWNVSKIQEAFANEKPLGSNCVSEFGKFIKYNSSLTIDKSTGIYEFGNTENGTDLASSTIIADLVAEEPKEIKMFVWIEGQDADCWNDIASGSFVVNLEFAAQNKADEE